MTITKDDLLLMIKAADPLDRAEFEAWPSRSQSENMLARIYTSGLPVPRRRRRVVAIAAGTAVFGLGAAGVAAASGVLGRPAPEPVKEYLVELDRGMPDDLRYNPDVDNARAVAAAAGGVVYLADLAGGGYCIEVSTKQSHPGGASCVTADDLKSRPIDVLAPLPAGDDAPLLIGGRVNSGDIATVQARFADGEASTIAFGLDRAWLLEVPADERASVLAEGLVIEGVSTTGMVMSSQQVPPMLDDDPLGTKYDATQPLVLETISDGSDLTRVLGIKGRVNVPGSPTLEVRYPDGTSTTVALGAGGLYEFRIPADRQDDFARIAGALVAIRNGAVVASTPIHSVAYGRAHNG